MPLTELGGEMRSFYYRSGRTVFAALILALLAFATGKIGYEDGSFPLMTFAAVMVVGTIKCALDAMSGQAAMKFDHRSIWMRRPWGGLEEVPWRDVHDISAKVFTLRYMGVIPVGRTAYITVTCEGGVLGARRFRVSTTALGLSAAESAALLLVLKQAHLDAVGAAGVAMAAAGSRGWGVGSANLTGEREEPSGFDADAAVARYLASKQANEPAPAAPSPKVAQPSMPQRPVFGRRVG